MGKVTGGRATRVSAHLQWQKACHFISCGNQGLLGARAVVTGLGSQRLKHVLSWSNGSSVRSRGPGGGDIYLVLKVNWRFRIKMGIVRQRSQVRQEAKDPQTWKRVVCASGSPRGTWGGDQAGGTSRSGPALVPEKGRPSPAWWPSC